MKRGLILMGGNSHNVKKAKKIGIYTLFFYSFAWKFFSVFDIWYFKNSQPKNQQCLNLIAEWMQRLFDHVFVYYDLPLP